MLGLLISGCLYHCAIPAAAYAAEARNPTWREMHVLYRWAADVCGPDGIVDFDPVPDRRGRDYLEPHCNSYGWNGRRYVGER